MLRKYVIVILMAFMAVSSALAQDSWQDNLYLGNGGQWKQRIRVDVSNNSVADVSGDSVSIDIGDRVGDARIVGHRAESVRVCDSNGNEMLFDLRTSQGNRLTKGLIPAKSVLSIPVECKANAGAVYWIYFDNSKAWEVPDYLDAVSKLANTSVEEGEGDTPSGWKHDQPDSSHKASWSTQNPHSGKKCLKLQVEENASPTWISTRQSNIRIFGGATYRVRGWVRSENSKGVVGWYIHVGNDQTPMMLAPMLDGGPGTYGWKEVSTEFTAPKDATKAELGTVLYGTGTAWFDDISLETDAKNSVTASVSSPEKLVLKEFNNNNKWVLKNYRWRYPVRISNMSDQTLLPGKVCMDVSGAVSRLRGRSSIKDIKLYDGDRLVKYTALGDSLLFTSSKIPAMTVKTYYLYFPLKPRVAVLNADIKMMSRSTGTSEDDRQSDSEAFKNASVSREYYESLLNDPLNLIKNPSFEDESSMAAVWPGGAEGTNPAGSEIGLVNQGLFGKKCTRIYVPDTSNLAWLGWRQDVPVKENRSYLYAGWVRCEDAKGDAVTLHAHINNNKDEVIVYTAAGPAISGDKGWSMVSGIFSIPQGASIFQAHLTMHNTGTVYQDGILLMEVKQAAVGDLETAVLPAQKGITAWQVNAIEKVFRDDLPYNKITSAYITAAGNEYEPLQIALRSSKSIRNVAVSVDFPKNKSGVKLSQCDIGVVGYVPIDHPTSYYSLTTPYYYRKYPTSQGACDGWAGMWPDPLLPKSAFDLEANSTQPVWVTVRIPKKTPAGEYNGKVKFTANGKLLKAIPFTVRIWGFDLPDENHSVAVYDSRMDSRWQIPGQSEEATTYQYWKFLADHRLCSDTIMPAPEIKYENGKVEANFAEFDRAAKVYFDQLKMNHTYTPWSFYMFGWGFPPSDRFGEQPYTGEYPFNDVDRSVLRPEYKKAMQAVIKVYWDHMKANGWDKYVAYYISDEPFYSQTNTIKQMQALCKMIAEVDPEIKIFSSTWGHVPDWDGYINLWGIGHYGVVSEEKMEKIRASGARMRFTTDGQMCTDTPYCAIERLLPHYAFKYGADGYEFWGSNWLTYDPYKFGWHQYIFQSDTPGKSYYVRYPNGDGFIAYPGAPIGHKGPVPSIRMEQAREGVEDYEYLYMLSNLIDQAKVSGKETKSAQKVLDYAKSLVSMPSAGGRYSTKILPNPDAVFSVKKAVAREIELLKNRK